MCGREHEISKKQRFKARKTWTGRDFPATKKGKVEGGQMATYSFGKKKGQGRKKTKPALGGQLNEPEENRHQWG